MRLAPKVQEEERGKRVNVEPQAMMGIKARED